MCVCVQVMYSSQMQKINNADKNSYKKTSNVLRTVRSEEFRELSVQITRVINISIKHLKSWLRGATVARPLVSARARSCALVLARERRRAPP